MVRAFPDGPPIVAAGGISTGSQVAALLTLGASGVVVGTRFLATPESRYSQAQKDALLTARSTSTVRTMAFDRIRGTLGWPAGVDGRGLTNKVVDNLNSGMPLDEAKREFEKAKGTKDGLIVWSGTGVGLVNEIQPTKVRATFTDDHRSYSH